MNDSWCSCRKGRRKHLLWWLQCREDRAPCQQFQHSVKLTCGRCCWYLLSQLAILHHVVWLLPCPLQQAKQHRLPLYNAVVKQLKQSKKFQFGTGWMNLKNRVQCSKCSLQIGFGFSNTLSPVADCEGRVGEWSLHRLTPVCQGADRAHKLFLLGKCRCNLPDQSSHRKTWSKLINEVYRVTPHTCVNDFLMILPNDSCQSISHAP